MDKKLFKDAGILFAITLVAGLLLGLVYEITKEPIAMAAGQAREDASRAVFESADSFGVVAIVGLEEIIEEGGFDVTIDGVESAYDQNGQMLGYVFSIISHEGYGGDISLLMGIQLDGTVNGYEILSISETAGLGMKAKEDAFKNQFNGVKTDQFTNIDGISGATVTTTAMKNGLNAGLYIFDQLTEATEELTGGAAYE